MCSVFKIHLYSRYIGHSLSAALCSRVFYFLGATATQLSSTHSLLRTPSPSPPPPLRHFATDIRSRGDGGDGDGGGKGWFDKGWAMVVEKGRFSQGWDIGDGGGGGGGRGEWGR